MDRRIFHGKLTPLDISRSLMGHFHRGNLRVQHFGDAQRAVVQIASTAVASSGGQTALSATILQVEDGVSVELSKQNWIGIAASLGVSAIAVFKNPFNLLSRLDDIAQDFEYLRLTDEIWKVIEGTAQALGATTELSERLRRVPCAYCNTANPPGEPRCLACGAPLGDIQPRTCRKCGYVVKKHEGVCPNCQSPLPQ